ncbi:MAG: oxygen-independent coproporphyrinogen III oxidase, partial [Caulobacter sp. 35-67-4]
MPLALAATAGVRPTAELIARYDGRAPRYTSYPPATQFSAQVDAETYALWLRDLPVEQAVSLYVHIPFCARLCWYCGCNTRAVNRHEPVGDYVRLLLNEIALLGAALPGRLPVGAIHFGGGTPNMLSTGEIDAIFDRLGEVFALTADVDVAVEMDPAVLTRDWVRAAARRGMNRASLGVQNLTPEVQAAVNRRDTFEHIADCVAWLREARIGSINIDLMYGLPHQTTANTLSTLDQLLPLRPERLALFGYAHVPWMKSHQQLIDEAALPDAQARLDQSETAAERLAAEGYVRIGLDHFALPEDPMAKAQAAGTLRRNFQGYTTDDAPVLLGFGASAIGMLPQGYVQNLPATPAWHAALEAGNLPVARGFALSAEDRLRRAVIERLMCEAAVDLDAELRAHGFAAGTFVPELDRLQALEQDGLVVRAAARRGMNRASLGVQNL